jgi:hypothetical protein
VLALALAGVISGLWWVAHLSLATQRSYSAVEAASLAAAEDLSKIVVNDPYYGYVALSDYAPIGKYAVAADGEPLPVLGINTIVATARLQMLIADQAGNAELRILAQEDVEAARHAAELLSSALNASIDPQSGYQAHDCDGNIVRPFDDALEAYLKSVDNASPTKGTKICKFQLSMGWLKNGGDSNTRAPIPEDMSEMSLTRKFGGNYRAFTDIPACGESFYFAGLSTQPSLADISQFMNPDGKRFCSIVKVDADVLITPAGCNEHSNPETYVRTSACAEPFSLPDNSTPGLLAINFMHGLVPGIASIQDILNDKQLNANKVEILIADGGDFPVDITAKLIPTSESDSIVSISQVFAIGFHDWLRTAHSRPRIDSVLNTISTSFGDSAQLGPGSRQYPTLFYEIDPNGNIRISNLRENPFFAVDTLDASDVNRRDPRARFCACTYDRQNYAVNYDAIMTGAESWMMVYRDYARTLGTFAGGKHAGQVLPGDPVNWCELAQFASSPLQALEKGKGELALGLQACGQMNDQGAVMLDGAYFSKRDGNALARQPRKSHYSGGLAAYFELSSPLSKDFNSDES